MVMKLTFLGGGGGGGLCSFCSLRWDAGSVHNVRKEAFMALLY